MVLKARAIYDCEGEDDQELSFKVKDIIVDSKYDYMYIFFSIFFLFHT